MSTVLETAVAGAAPVTELLLLRQGAEYFAFVLTSAMEAMELPALSRIPGAPAALLGMLTDRGTGIPVFAGSRILAVEGRSTSEQVLVIVRDGERLVGLVVDEVEEDI